MREREPSLSERFSAIVSPFEGSMPKDIRDELEKLYRKIEKDAAVARRKNLSLDLHREISKDMDDLYFQVLTKAVLEIRNGGGQYDGQTEADDRNLPSASEG